MPSIPISSIRKTKFESTEDSKQMFNFLLELQDNQIRMNKDMEALRDELDLLRSIKTTTP